MVKERDFNLGDATSAARRLSPEPGQPLAKDLRASLRLLDEQLSEDPSLDPVTSLRSALDCTEVLAEEPGLHDISERVKQLLEHFRITTPDEVGSVLRQMEGTAAVGMIGSLGSLRAAMDQDPVEFMFNNPSDTWQNIEASQTLFRAVGYAKRLLNEIAQATKVGKKNLSGADQLVVALQDQLARQLGRADIKAHAQPEQTAKNKIKKIGGQVIDLRSGDSRRAPW